MIDSVIFDKQILSNFSGSRQIAKNICKDIDLIKELPKEKESVIIETMQHFVANFIRIHNLNDCSIQISRRREDYFSPTRYKLTYCKYSIFIKIMDLLEKYNYIEMKKGSYNKETKKGLQTRLIPTEKLNNIINKIEDNGVFRMIKETIILKNENKELIEYEDTKEIELMRKNLKKINAFNSSHKFKLNSTTLDPQVYRVFNNSNFNQGGRFYGTEIQQLPKKTRLDIKIDNEDIIELDFSSLHPNMLYNMEKQLLRSKAYDIGLYIDRNLIKKWILISINAKNRTSAKKAYISYIVNEYNEFKYMEKGEPSKIFDLIDEAFKKNHPLLINYLYSGKGIDLQYHDSNIMEMILINCMKEEIPCCPIHDSIIIKKSNEYKAREIMVKAYKEYIKKTFNFEADILVEANKK